MNELDAIRKLHRFLHYDEDMKHFHDAPFIKKIDNLIDRLTLEAEELYCIEK